MRSLLCVLVAFAFGCASTPVKRESTMKIPERTAMQPLPAVPDEVPEGTHATEPLSEGDAAPFDGLLVDEKRIFRVSEIAVAYTELRRMYEADRASWERQEGVYERYLTVGEEQADFWKQKAERDWLERNGGTLGLVVGFVGGAVITTVIVFGVKEAKE